MRFMSIDQSTTAIGLCIKENDELILYRFFDLTKLPIEQSVESRIDLMKNIMLKYIYKYQVSFVTLEDVFLKTTKGVYSNYNSFKVLCELLGVLKNKLYSENILYQLIKPSEFRSTCKIKGREREEQKLNAIKFVKEKYNLDVEEDLAEAICMAYHTSKKIIPKIKVINK